MIDTYGMIIACIISGFVSSMNTWADKYDDMRFFHMNDVYMISLMTFVMFFVMILLSGQTKTNIVTLAILLFMILVIFISIQKQLFVSDKQFIKGMIPHHSMAITMAKNILRKTDNDDIKALAKNIIDTQEKEIMIMKSLDL